MFLGLKFYHLILKYFVLQKGVRKMFFLFGTLTFWNLELLLNFKNVENCKIEYINLV